MTKAMTKELAQELVEFLDQWGIPDEYEERYAAFAERSAEEMAEQFRRVEDLLRGLEYTAESALGFGASLILGEAQQHAWLARRLCEGDGKER